MKMKKSLWRVVYIWAICFMVLVSPLNMGQLVYAEEITNESSMTTAQESVPQVLSTKLASTTPVSTTTGAAVIAITTAQEFQAIGNDLEAVYELKNDIDFAGITYEPIGSQSEPFKGELNGNGYQLQNINVDRGRDRQGLFVSMEDASIHDVNITGFVMKGNSYVGGLASKGKDVFIKNVAISGEVQAQNQYAGGLFAEAESVIAEEVTVSGNVKANNYVGGLVGSLSSGNFTKVLISGTVRGINDYVGGISGMASEVNVKEATVEIDLRGNNCIGGLFGQIGEATITDAIWKGYVESSNQYSGGFIGRGTEVSIKNGFSYGHVSGNNYMGLIGGSIDEGSISVAVAAGSVLGGNDNIGVLAGYLKEVQVDNVYAIGKSKGVNGISGLIGKSEESTVVNAYMTGDLMGNNHNGVIGTSTNDTITNCYFDQDQYGFNQPTEQARTTDAMYRASTYNGWDFDNVWKLEEDASYPVLRALPVPLTNELAYFDIRINDVTKDSYTISFQEIYGADVYDIEVNGTIVDSISNTTYSAFSLEAGTVYDIRVRAKNSLFTTPYSSTVHIVTLPLTPTNIVSETSKAGNRISFDTTKGADGYEIEVMNGVVDLGTDTTYLHTNLSDNTQYVYRVRAKNAFGTSEWSANIIQKTLPGSPKNLTLTPEQSSIKLEWNPVPGTINYEVEINGTSTIETTDSVYQGTNLLEGERYSYRVRAKNSEGYGDWSDSVSIFTKLSAPTNISVDNQKTYVDISFDSVSNADSYEIRVNNQVVSLGSATSYHHVVAVDSEFNTYEIRAINSNTNSDWTDKIIVSRLADAPIITRYDCGTSELEIEWLSVDQAVRYDVEINGAIVSTTDTKMLKNDIVAGNVYDFRMRAITPAGNGDWTAMYTLTAPLVVPTNLQATVKTDSIELSWDAVAGVDGYELIVDGVSVACSGNTYTHANIQPNTIHMYRIRSIKGTNTSDYSNPLEVVSQLAQPSIKEGSSKNGSVYLTWDAVAGAVVYDLEINGQLVKDINGTSYIHKNVEYNKVYSYRLRAKNQYSTSDFSEYYDVLTAPYTPAIPGSTEFYNVIRQDDAGGLYTVELKWFESMGATSYDLKVDGIIVERIMDRTYSHEDLQPNTAHRYQVRAVNAGGKSEWSEAFVINTPVEMKLQLSQDEYFNFVFVVPKNGTDSKRKVTVHYDEAALEVVDLCALTSEVVKEAKVIDGVGLTVESVEDGKIVFEVDTSGRSGMNIIKFVVKETGFNAVTYDVE